MDNFMDFIWNTIESFIDVIVYIINFIKELITFIPKHLSFLPNEIEIMFIPVITIIIFVSIYKFVK